MLVVKIIGGIGNQMFQYAFVKALQKRNPNQKFFLDISNFSYKELSERKYELDCFGINEAIADQKLVQNFQPAIGKVEKLKRFFSFQKYLINSDESNYFKADLLKTYSENTYFEGYWQSEKYFLDIETEIRQIFTVKKALNTQTKPFLDQIRACDSVSLHVRRGDYVQNPIFNQVHGLCSLEYYQKAVDLISQKLEKPVFFVFSDDIFWCKKHLKFDVEIVFVAGNFLNYEDLSLMSACKHQIIANSSFSWWGAWLNNFAEKIIIAPKKWFVEKEIKDLIPQHWIRL